MVICVHLERKTLTFSSTKRGGKIEKWNEEMKINEWILTQMHSLKYIIFDWYVYSVMSSIYCESTVDSHKARYFLLFWYLNYLQCTIILVYFICFFLFVFVLFPKSSSFHQHNSKFKCLPSIFKLVEIFLFAVCIRALDQKPACHTLRRSKLRKCIFYLSLFLVQFVWISGMLWIEILRWKAEK